MKEETLPGIEPQFLSLAQAGGVTVQIGQMNNTEHKGTIHDVGRYEINILENGKIVTILKQEIAYFSVSRQVLTISPCSPLPDAGNSSGRPNIQHEFLDKAIKENQVLTFFLFSGKRIKATIEAYDSFTILLKENGRQHLYYKHSITTINR